MSQPARFCIRCGAAVPVADSRFCFSCGAEIVSPALIAEQSPLSAQELEAQRLAQELELQQELETQRLAQDPDEEPPAAPPPQSAETPIASGGMAPNPSVPTVGGPRAGKFKSLGKWMILGLVAVLVLVVVLDLAIPAKPHEDSKPAKGKVQKTNPYAGGRYSCNTFRNFQNDIANGFLTNPEMREELKKVQSRGSTAEPEIRAASTALLRSVTSAGFSPTQQELDSLLSASLAMTEACKKYGY